MGLAETLPGDAIISLEELRRRIRSSSPAWQLYKMALNNERKGRQQEAFSLAVKARQMEPRLFQVRAALAAHYFLGCALQDMGIHSGEHFAAAENLRRRPPQSADSSPLAIHDLQDEGSSFGHWLLPDAP